MPLDACPSQRPRATPLPPQERRQRILAAALPLVLTHGLDVTTKQLADAAGVAEGTLFRVFDSKEELLLQAARTAFDATDHLAELQAIDPSASLEQRVSAVVASAQRHAGRIMKVFVAFGKPADRRRLGDLRELGGHGHSQAVTDLVTRLIEPDAGRLRLSVPEVVRLLGMLAWTSVHPMQQGTRMSAEQVTELLLHGVLTGPGAPPADKPLDPDPT